MYIERLASIHPPPPPRVTGNAQGASARHAFEAVGARHLSLEVVFPDKPWPRDTDVLSDVTVHVHGRLEILTLGRCRFEAIDFVDEGPQSSEGPASTIGPPRSVGEASWLRPTIEGLRGKLVPVDAPIHCWELFRSGRHMLITDTFDQLPLLFARKELIAPEFRRFMADLVYDLRVYRSIFDEIDVGLAAESEAVRAELERAIIAGPGRRLMSFINEKTAALEEIVRHFSRQDHERHGFYFRRQLWDVILTAPFVARTNLRPRGYAGDWLMMQYLYRDEYVGSSLFGKLLHKNTMEVAAAAAVRSRRRMIVEALEAERRRRGARPGEPLRFLSIACGPACEVGDLLGGAEDSDAYECALLDQDEEALHEASRGIVAIERRLGRRVRARFIRQSVRTMLRTPHFAEVFGRHHVVYSMGLFDYLTAPVATAVLQKLYELLEPGGLMIVGNFHVANPTRWYMEYWLDWTLIYRTEEEMLALAADIPGASCSVLLDEMGCQMFLRVRKAEG